METTLHYAPLVLGGDIPRHVFNSKKGVLKFFQNLFLKEPNTHSEKTVYLLAMQGEIFISTNTCFIEELFESKLNSIYPYYEGDGNDIFLQEYASFEEAYKVALDMKEEDPLCYDKDHFRNEQNN